MKIWIYLNGVQNGPYDLENLTRLPVTGSTPVWHEGMADWQPAAKAPATAKFFPQGLKSKQAVMPQPVSPEMEKVAEALAPEVFAETEQPGETVYVAADQTETEVTSASGDDPRTEDITMVESVARNVAEQITGETTSHIDEEAPTQVATRDNGAETEQVTEQVTDDIGEDARTVEISGTVVDACPDTSPDEPAIAEISQQTKPVTAVRCPAFLPWSIVLTCCCCTPTSVAAIITGAITLRRRKKGNLRGARKMSRVTEWLVIISITLGIMSVPLSWMLML